MTDELIGKRFGGYEIIDVIGKGGMATVYRAHQVSMNRIVALKVLPRQFLHDESYMMRFNREVKIIAQLEHRNIVPVHDYGEEAGQPYIVMRYMDGGSVDDLLNVGAIPLNKIVSILDQIAPALDYAHSQQVLHRDMKPSNVLLDGSNGAFLTDFGIARIMGDPTISTATQGVIGTPSYMSPEQAQGQTLDNRSDLYSLGVMLFEMATGRRPFESDTPYGVAVLQVTTPPPAPRSLNPLLPPAVEGVILAMMRKKREERFADAAALATAFRRAVDGSLQITEIDPPVASISISGQATTPTPPFPEPPLRQSAPASYIPPVNAPVNYTPVPHMPVSEPHYAPVPRARRRGRGSWWIGGIVGVLIGCGLLTVILLVGALLLEQTSREETVIRAATNTAAMQATLDSMTPFVVPPIDRSDEPASTPATDQATEEASLTPLTGVATDAPIGVRPIDTTLTGQIVYFAERAANGRATESGQQGDYNLYMLDLATRAESRISGTAYAELYPSVSPDGELIAFIADRENQFDLYVMTFATRTVRRLTTTAAPDRAPSWSPDGEHIIFSSDTNGNGAYDLYRVTPNGTDLEILHNVPIDQRASDAVYTPDGEYILFTQGDAGNAGTWEIMRLEVATGDVIGLTDNNVKDWQPIPAPDGGVLYLTESINGDALAGYSGIALMTIDGADAQILYDGAGYENTPRYSTDGSLLIFASDISGRDEIYALPAASLPDAQIDPEQVTSEGGFAPMWLSD